MSNRKEQKNATASYHANLNFTRNQIVAMTQLAENQHIPLGELLAYWVIPGVYSLITNHRHFDNAALADMQERLHKIWDC